jgi:HK97 family phage major capsid protein
MTSAEQLLDELERVARRQKPRRRSSLEEYRSQARLGVESGITDPELSWWRYALSTSPDPKRSLDLAEERALSKATGAAGAFLVPADFEQMILSAVRARGSVSRVAREFTTSAGTDLPIAIASSHPAGVWVAEGGTYTGADDVLAQVVLKAWKSASLCIVSEELSRDALVEFDAYLSGELAARISALESAAFVNGNGTSQPQGFLAVFPTSTAATGSATSFTLTDLVNALHVVPVDYRNQGGAWIGSDGILKALRLKITSGGDPIFPSLHADPPSLFGYPFLTDENMPAPAASAKSLAFAGWQAAYGIRRVSGISVTRLVEAYSNLGQLAYKANLRTDGKVLLSAAGVACVHSAT